MRITSRGKPITLSDEIGEILSDDLPTDSLIDKFVGSTDWKEMLLKIIGAMNKHIKGALK